jgi:hypothetical protein
MNSLVHLINLLLTLKLFGQFELDSIVHLDVHLIEDLQLEDEELIYILHHFCTKNLIKKKNFYFIKITRKYLDATYSLEIEPIEEKNKH